ncbi:hypothetical protein BCR33DRAFT_717731 [Rhizoclosmatium globosum]|uniref:Uncharacterized protein n=1 Tax=Rhizoclosmatium globosum TaxID=329046 RepID=A0A1Y2C7T2_9FUNG|nr:hypothetical protein BCR33DRAFT_717731 [Rhizoclosmatium globosum]|eukprot:ORY43006.1 hypothetical protein BCR33DRAFT_717731 [Rhizoclosmatium globosum]
MASKSLFAPSLMHSNDFVRIHFATEVECLDSHCIWHYLNLVNAKLLRRLPSPYAILICRSAIEFPPCPRAHVSSPILIG